MEARTITCARHVIALALVSCGLLGATQCAHAGSGAPDPAFGSAGQVALPFHVGLRATNRPVAIVGDPDGGLVVLHKRDLFGPPPANAATRTEVVLTRRMPDGSFDRAFGTSRPIRVPAGFEVDGAIHRADGDLQVIGHTPDASGSLGTVRTLRIRRDGVAVGSGMVRSIEFPHFLRGGMWWSWVDAVSMEPDGSAHIAILQQVRPVGDLAGREHIGSVLIATLRPDGTLDRGFAGGAADLATPDIRNATGADVALADAPGGGTYAVVGRSDADRAEATDVWRLTPVGMLDAGFGGGHLSLTAAGGPAVATGRVGVRVLRSGDVVVRSDAVFVDLALPGTETPAAVIKLHRFASDGSPISGFGHAGTASVTADGITSADTHVPDALDHASTDVLEQPDGKLLLPVSVRERDDFEISGESLLRTTPQGVLDTTYDLHGAAALPALPRTGWVTGERSHFVDAMGRFVTLVTSASTPAGSPEGASLLRMDGGDAAGSPATVTVYQHPGCGSRRISSCSWGLRRPELRGTVRTAAGPAAGVHVVLDLQRPGTVWHDPALRLDVVTDDAGTFTARPPVSRLRAGTWEVRARAGSGATSLRAAAASPSWITVGRERDALLYDQVERTRALAWGVYGLVDEAATVHGLAHPPRPACPSLASCTGGDPLLGQLTTFGAHPRPGRATIDVGAPGRYAVRARVPTRRFHLEFVVDHPGFGENFRCEGDHQALERWCPDGSWETDADDPYAVFGIDARTLSSPEDGA